MSIKPRRRFGQNFLQDEFVIEQIIRKINPKSEDSIIEIGPGLGAITLPILAKVSNLKVIEIDRDLAQNLNQKNLYNLKVIVDDALKVDFSKFGDDLIIVGNLPYNISTPLLFHLLNFKSSISTMFFLLQKELVERICSVSNNKTYGRLSVAVQAQCAVENLLGVANTAFYPAPKVESAFIKITPKPNTIKPASFDLIVKTCFSKRRKTLLNNLVELVDKQKLQSVPVDLSLRAESLTISDFINLAEWFDNL